MDDKTLFLDSFALVNVVADPAFAAAARNFVISRGYTLIIGVMNLVEIYRWKKRWSEVADLISSLPFDIAQNPDQIADEEARNYPNDIVLPVGFRSSDYSYSSAELKNALEVNLRDRISSFDQGYRKEQRSILEAILNNRSTFPPEADGKYSPFQRWLFLQTNVLRMLYPKHRDFLNEQVSQSHEIRIDRFKSAFIQVLAIFLEYYIQKKDGKPSDIGDFYQLSLVPYVAVAVVDNERKNLIQRMNRTGLFPKDLPAFSLAEFRSICENRA